MWRKSGPSADSNVAQGTGSEAYAPLARAVIGGIAVSLLLTIFIVPAAYLLAYRRRRQIIPGEPIAA